jgi:hypothetical protein
MQDKSAVSGIPLALNEKTVMRCHNNQCANGYSEPPVVCVHLVPDCTEQPAVKLFSLK